MNRIDGKFSELRAAKRTALMPYLPLGYPTLAQSLDLIYAAADAGADLIELGLAFSDPLADGPVISRAMHVALQNGMTMARALEIVRAARKASVSIPLALMGYYNPILRFGVEAFVREAAAAGADGFIVPDLPPEQSGALDQACREYDLGLIFLAAPTSTPERLKIIAAATRPFVYLVSVTGVTGARAQVAGDLAGFVGRLRAITDKPLCVGFGIGSAESARRVASLADGVIVGSALVERIGQGDAVEAARKFIGELRAGVDTPLSSDTG